MRVVINQWSALRQKTGIGHYTTQLLRSLPDQAPDDEFDGYPSTRLLRFGNPCVASLDFIRSITGKARPYLSTSYLAVLGVLPRMAGRKLAQWGKIAHQRYFESYFHSDHYDLYHEPNYSPFRTPLPTVVTMHDLSVLLYPQWHPPARVAHHEKHFYTRVRSYRHILTDSECVRRQAIQLLGISPCQITRVYLGVRPHFRPLPVQEVNRQLGHLGLQPGYLLAVGTIEPRKNILMLMQSYCSLPHEHRERCPLLLVGKWGWKTEAIAGFFDSTARHRGVRHLDYVPERVLPALYNGARALVFPSFYEGFGLPPVEMLACGGAVLASTAEAVTETIGGQAHLIDADDADGWRAAMARVIVDEDWRQQLRVGSVETAQHFTWEACAAETLTVYRLASGISSESSERRRAA